MKQGFYFFKILVSYSLVYILKSLVYILKNDGFYNEYKTRGVGSILSGDVEMEYGDESYILKTSKTTGQYHFISDEPYDKWKNVFITFIFTYYESN